MLLSMPRDGVTLATGSYVEASMETVISILIGSGITWFVSQWYYRKAAEDLQKEAAKLRDVTTKTWELSTSAEFSPESSK